MQTRSKGKNSNIRVVVRIRPENDCEQNEKFENVTEAISDHMLVFDPKTSGNSDFLIKKKRRVITERRFKDLKYAFDHVFKPLTSNKDVFNETTHTVVSDVLKGYNCSVFAYGATGSGKTHTMLGNEKEPGVIYYTMINLYERIAELQEEKNFNVAVSYLEVYNETVRDLLMPRENLPIREDKSVGIVISGLSLHKPENADELLSMLRYGNQNRTQHPTDANAESSRSHAVFQVYVKQRPRTAGSHPEVSIAKMCLVDLAGSERASKNSNYGARFREGANINRSLLALGNVINALADNKFRGYVPYRDSKLTRLLKDSLGGNCQTIMIATISPSSRSYEDTYNTLRYADRAKLIKADLKKNVLSIDQHIVNYKKYVADLEKENQELRKTKKNLEELSDKNTRPQIVSPSVKQYQDKLEDLFKTRKTIVKAWINAEVTKRELKWKMSRKERAVRRIVRLTGSKDVVNKHGRIIERMKKLYAKEETTKEKSIEQLKKQDDAIYKVCSEMQVLNHSDKLSLEFMNMSLQHYGTKSHLLDAETYLGFVRRMARAQERQSAVNERLILSLINVVKKQHDILQSRGLSDNELESDYLQCCYMVEEKGVSWVQHHSEKNSSGADTSSPNFEMQESDQDFSISEIIDIKMPKISWEVFQDNGNKSSSQSESGAQRVLKQPSMKPVARTLCKETKSVHKTEPTLPNQPWKPAPTVSVVKPELSAPAIKVDTAGSSNGTADILHRDVSALKASDEIQPVSPLAKDVATECGSLVKKLVDRYSKGCSQAAQPVVPPMGEKPLTPVAKKRLQWPDEEAKLSVISSSFPSNVLNTTGDVQCESCKESTASDALNMTFEIFKPAIPNTPCIDDVTVKVARPSPISVNDQDHVSPGQKSKRLSSSRRQLTPCKLNFASEACKVVPLLKSKEFAHGDHLHTHNLRSRHSMSSPHTPIAVASHASVKQRKRHHSLEQSPQQTKCKSMSVLNSSNKLDSSPSRSVKSQPQVQIQGKSSQHSIDVNQSCSNSTEGTSLSDKLFLDERSGIDPPCRSSTPENDTRTKENAQASNNYEANPYMQHIMNSLKKHGKTSLTAMLLRSKQQSKPSEENQRLPFKFVDVSTAKTSVTGKSKQVAMPSTALTQVKPMTNSDLNPLKARINSLKERRHFRSLASKPYAREASTRRNRNGPGLTRKPDSDKDNQDVSRPSYMLPTFAASQKMNGLEQGMPGRTRTLTTTFSRQNLFHR